MIAGRNAVLEALQARVPATALYVAYRTDADDRIRAAVRLAADAGLVVLFESGRGDLDRLTQGAVHQGLALRVRPYQYAHPDDLIALAADARSQPPLIVALDGITDPRNLGAIVRSAAAFGGHGVLIPGRRSAGVTAGAWKASAGTLARLPVAQAPNLARTLAAYQQAGLFVAGLAADGGTDISDLEIAESPLVLVVGSEGRGLSRIVAERCDLLARIPIGAAESLNASVAAGIALHECGPPPCARPPPEATPRLTPAPAALAVCGRPPPRGPPPIGSATMALPRRCSSAGRAAGLVNRRSGVRLPSPAPISTAEFRIPAVARRAPCQSSLPGDGGEAAWDATGTTGAWSGYSMSAGSASCGLRSHWLAAALMAMDPLAGTAW